MALRDIDARLAARTSERQPREVLAALKTQGLIALAGHGRGALEPGKTPARPNLAYLGLFWLISSPMRPYEVRRRFSLQCVTSAFDPTTSETQPQAI